MQDHTVPTRTSMMHSFEQRLNVITRSKIELVAASQQVGTKKLPQVQHVDSDLVGARLLEGQKKWIPREEGLGGTGVEAEDSWFTWSAWKGAAIRGAVELPSWPPAAAAAISGPSCRTKSCSIGRLGSSACIATVRHLLLDVLAKHSWY